MVNKRPPVLRLRSAQTRHDLFLQKIAEDQYYGEDVPVNVYINQRYRRLMAGRGG